ncbi:MAG: DUF86 domain-containing protein [Phycisphaerales bacterium]
MDIGRAARLAMEFVRGMTTSEFMGDAKSQSAVIHQLMLLGEATKRLSQSFRVAHPSVPWDDIAGMRDRLTRVRPGSARHRLERCCRAIARSSSNHLTDAATQGLTRRSARTPSRSCFLIS